MSTEAIFTRVTPSSNPVPDRGASALYGGRLFRSTTQSRTSDRLHASIPLSSCIFCTGELDGAEGIDSAET